MTFGAFGMQGRYFFPMIAALGVVVSLGFYSLLPGRWRAVPVTGLSLALFALAALTPARIIRPAYPYLGDSPAILQTRQFERSDDFGGVIKLAGYSVTLQNNSLNLTLFGVLPVSRSRITLFLPTCSIPPTAHCSVRMTVARWTVNFPPTSGVPAM
jgi:hypothetical protein